MKTKQQRANRVQCPAGVPEPYHVRARESVECAVLVITKARFDSVLAHYPEQNDIILTNLLYQYGLTRDGDDIGNAHVDQGNVDEGFTELRSAIKVRLDPQRTCSQASHGLAA